MQYYVNPEMDQITDKIWLGNYEAAKNKKNLKRFGITKVLSVMDYAPHYNIEDNIYQKEVEVIDVPTFNIIRYFGDYLCFMEGNDKVLVHCMSGVSRSATILLHILCGNTKNQLKKLLIMYYLRDILFFLILVFKNN